MFSGLAAAQMQGGMATGGGGSLEARANAAFMAKNFREAATLYADLLEENPLNGKAWYNLGFSQNMNGEFAKSASSFEKSYTAGFMPVLSMYNAACGYSRIGEKAKALFWLQKIADAGYRDVGQISRDSDFDNIRNEPKYAQILEQVKNNATPCEKSEEARQFDFWVGEWAVWAPGGQEAGKSKVERAIDQCALVENWWGVTGSQGKSLNLYNTSLKKWQQFWVDNGGVSTLYTGERVGNEMRFQADSVTREGKPVKRKMTFFLQDDGKVRQVGESSMDNGKTWKVEYDLIYTKVKG